MANIKTEKANASNATAIKAVFVLGMKKIKKIEKTIKIATAIVTNLAMTYSLKCGRLNT
jgi:hypothetical protein